MNRFKTIISNVFCIIGLFSALLIIGTGISTNEEIKGFHPEMALSFLFCMIISWILSIEQCD